MLRDVLPNIDFEAPNWELIFTHFLVDLVFKIDYPIFGVKYKRYYIMGPNKEELTKLYYSIGEVSKMFDVSKSLIRFWESEFDLLRPHKNSKGDRRFTQQNIHQFQMIYHLVKERGFTLDGAKKELKQNKERISQKYKTLESLHKVKSFLEKMQKGLDA